MKNKKSFISTTFFISIFSLGLAVPMLGITLVDLTRRFDVPLANGGIFTAAMGLGTIFGSILAGRLYDRLNARQILPAFKGLLAVSYLLLYLAPVLWMALAASLMLGLTFGVYMLGPNILTARLNPDKATGALNALNALFGVGAVLSPQLINLAIALGAAKFAYLFVAGLLLVQVIPLIFIDIPAPEEALANNNAFPLNWGVLLPFAILFFCGVSAEISFNAWIVTQLDKVAHADLTVANFAASFFWGGYTVSRIGAAWAGRWLSPQRLLVIAILILLGGISLLLLVPTSVTAGVVSAFIVGLGVGPFFPTNMSLASIAFPRTYSRAVGILNAFANAGAMLIPYLQGQLGGGEDGGMEMILLLGIVLLVTALFIGQRSEVTGEGPV